jgi:hypothetical protein
LNILLSLVAEVVRPATAQGLAVLVGLELEQVLP